MLDSLRGAAKSWVAKILIGILAVSFGVFWGIQDVFRGYHSTTLASVGGIDISVPEFTHQFEQAVQNYSRQTGQSISRELARQMGLDRQVLSDLMRSAALDAESRRMKLAVSNQQLAAEIAKNPAFKGADGQFDKVAFADILRRNGMTEDIFLASERHRFLRSAVSAPAGQDFVLPNALVEAAYRYRNEQRDVRYFIIKATASEIPPPSEQELKKYYEDNPQAYTAPEYRSLVVMKAEPSDIAPKIIISDAEIASGYEKHKTDYFTPETRTIEQIVFPSLEEARKAKDRISAGEDFLAIARERGLDASAINLGDRTKADIPDPKIADAAFSLTEGEISDPVEGQLSIALLRVTKITPEHQKTLAEVRDELRSRLQLEKAQQQMIETYNSVEDARAAQTKFEDIAAKAGIPIFTVPAIDANGLDKNGKPIDLPFKDEVLKASFASDVGVENDALTPGDAYVWYEVREVTPSALRPLDQIKDKVIADWTARKLRDLSLDKARKLVERARGGQSLDDLAKEAGAEVKTVQGLKRNETSGDFDSPAVSAIFSVPEQGFASAPEPDGKGAKVMQSQAVLTVPFDPNSPEATNVRNTLTGGAANDLTGIFLAGLQSDLGWSIDERLWSQISGNANP